MIAKASSGRDGRKFGPALLVGLAAAAFPAGLLVVHLTWWTAWSWAGVAMMILSPLVAARLYERWFRPGAFRPAMRRYNGRIIVTMLIYVGLLVAAVQLYKLGYAAGGLGYVIALAPALPIVACIGHMALFLKEEEDEFQRSILIQALLWSGALTFAEATVWGFLETFGKAPNVWMWVVPVVFFAQLGVAMPAIAWRYR